MNDDFDHLVDIINLFFRCPEFSIGSAKVDPAILDVQLEFLSSTISSELKESDVVISSEGHVALPTGKYPIAFSFVKSQLYLI